MFRSVTVDDAMLRYEVRSDAGGPALFLLNPLAASLEIWDAQLELAKDFTLVRFDPRGHGGSTFGSKAELTIEDLARDACAVLDDAGIARAHICGLSIGGMAAMNIATSLPRRVGRLVLCATTPYMPTREMWQARIDTARREGLSTLVDGILQRWFTASFHQSHPSEIQRVRELLMRTDPKGYAASAAAVRDMDQRESINSISVPTLVIAGAHDPGVPPAQAEAITRAVKDSSLLILESAHLPNIEQAPAFNAAIKKFLLD
jgi:3-oxoadipate enol-lactonase